MNVYVNLEKKFAITRSNIGFIDAKKRPKNFTKSLTQPLETLPSLKNQLYSKFEQLINYEVYFLALRCR